MNAKKPFEDLLVIELTTYWAATSAGRYLRTQGARVIKVEAPPNGDSVRYFGRTCGAPYLDNENPIHDLSNGVFLWTSSGKTTWQCFTGCLPGRIYL